MWNRILAVARARLSGEWMGERGSRLPVAPLLFHATLASLLCGLARGELGAFPYALFALSLPLVLTSIPLLGELGPLLRADPAEEWVAAQPLRPVELRMARVLCLAVLLGALALASLIPAAVFAPRDMSFAGRLALIPLGLAQTAFLAATLLWLQALFGKRGEGVLVLVQTALFAGVIVGAALGLRGLPALARLEGPAGALLALPQAWFANPFASAPHTTATMLAVTATLGAALTFALAPFPPAPRARRTGTPLDFILEPARRLATRFWVKREERGIFDLVYELLPTERDFVVRTYPLLAVPLAFLLLGADAGDPQGEGLLALLMFTPATYLPVMLAHVPATATPDARWLVETSPVTRKTEVDGARKALFMRFLLPLHIALTAVAWLQAGPAFALRIGLPAAAVTLLVLRLAWPICVERPPLSTSAADLGSAWNDSFTGVFFTLSIAMTIVAIATWRYVSNPLVGLVACVGIVALDALAGNRRLAERIDVHS